MSIQAKLVPSYEKCFLDTKLCDAAALTKGTCLRGEEYHFELIATATDLGNALCEYRFLHVDSPLANRITLSRIEQVPVRVPAYETKADADYLSRKSGLFPDLLLPMNENEPFEVPSGSLAALYFTVKIPEDCTPADYPITVTLSADTEKTSVAMTLTVLPYTLPKQTLVYTQWIHYDCMATAYSARVFSEKHWRIMENYVKCAVEHGVNAVLTPVFTPPLDTAVGGERPTVQLVDVTKTAEGWSFGFEKLLRFTEMCLRCGAEYFEISHFFTQWGAYHAPKIVATVNGKKKRVFGWDTDALSDEYVGFLRAFLTAFLSEMQKAGLEKRLIFHISDEPQEKHLSQYLAVKGKISDLLEGYTVMDALSDFDFYQRGIVEHPIPASDRIEPFLDARIEGLWTYYCCAQAVGVSNRFIAMPASRARMIGAELWKYQIAGFLHWGYNFWYSRFSRRRINPFVITDGAYFAPAGDAYSVYPGEDEKPYESLRLKTFAEALTDLRVFSLAESLCGREAVLSAVEADGTVTFSEYPREKDSAFALRERVNLLLQSLAK